MEKSRKDIVLEITLNARIAATYAVLTIVSNAFLIAWELSFYQTPFWMSVWTIALGEFIVMSIGYVAFILLKQSKGFLRAIKANQNLEVKF